VVLLACDEGVAIREWATFDGIGVPVVVVYFLP